jgi:hypothetical protein
MLEQAPNGHVGTDTEESYASAAEHVSELLYRHNQEISCWDDGTDFPGRLKDLLRKYGANDDTAHAASNAKGQSTPERRAPVVAQIRARSPPRRRLWRA